MEDDTLGTPRNLIPVAYIGKDHHQSDAAEDKRDDIQYVKPDDEQAKPGNACHRHNPRIQPAPQFLSLSLQNRYAGKGKVKAENTDTQQEIIALLQREPDGSDGNYSHAVEEYLP